MAQYAEEIWYRILCDECGTRGAAGITQSDAEERAVNFDRWGSDDGPAILCLSCQTAERTDDPQQRDLR